MFIATKYEEIFPLKLDTFCEKISRNRFSKEEIKQKELEILETLDFQLNTPNLIKFLGLKLNKLLNNEAFSQIPLGLLEKSASYFAKMVLYDYNLIAKFNGETLAEGVLLTSLKFAEAFCGEVENAKQVCKTFLLCFFRNLDRFLL